MATRRKAAAPAAEEVEDLDLEELDDTEEAPAKGKAAQEEVWGVRDLIALIKERTEKEYTPREVRTLLRKMARDGSGRVDREVIAGNKSRYAWSGPNDPEVRTILKAVKGGEIEAGKKEALDKLKADKAAKQAAAGTPTKSTKKVAKPPVDEDELEEVEDDEDDD